LKAKSEPQCFEGIALSSAFTSLDNMHEGDYTILRNKIFSESVIFQSGEQGKGGAFDA
jgi:hypothetical protein